MNKNKHGLLWGYFFMLTSLPFPMVIKNLKQTIVLFLFCLPVFCFAQDSIFNLSVLDLNQTPTFIKPPLKFYAFGNKAFVYLGRGGSNELLAYDGEQIESILKTGEPIRFYGGLNGGLLISLGHPAGGFELHIIDTVSYEIKPIFSERVHGDITILNSQVYFVANNNNLYVSDGTEESLKVLVTENERFTFPIIQSSIRNILIFKKNSQLWRTDGTTEGTYKIIDPFSGPFGEYIITLDNLLYLKSSEGLETKLWVTDGTLAGTKTFVGPNIGNENYFDISRPYPTENGLLFISIDHNGNRKLWITQNDGNSTKLLKNIIPSDSRFGFDLDLNTAGAYFREGILFFTSDNEIWRSDGSAVGTYPILTSSNSDFRLEEILQSTFSNKAGQVFFITRYRNEQYTLWSYIDQENPPIKIVSSSNNLSLHFAGANLYYYLNNQLWVTNGTIQGTVTLGEYQEFSFSNALDNFLLFTTTVETFGRELFVSDGTVVGTKMLKDIYPGQEGAKLSHFFLFQNKIHFYAEDIVNGQSLYSTDGTQEKTQLAIDLYPQTNSTEIDFFTAIGGQLYFVIDNTLWSSDGTIEGTINLNQPVDNLTTYQEHKSKMLFLNIRNELIATEGTLASTQIITSSSSNYVPFFFSKVVNYKDKLWFFFNDNKNGIELWQTDGTVLGTKMAFESEPGEKSLFSFIGTDLSSNGKYLFIKIARSRPNHQLWISDGTKEGTNLFIDLHGLSASNLINYKDKIIFTDNQGIWITDGTKNDTVLLENKPAGEISFVEHLNFKEDLIFSNNNELWRTNGTPEGTQLLFSESFGPRNLRILGDNLIFDAFDNTIGKQKTYITDATIEGVKLLEEVNPNFTSTPYNFAKFNDYTFFSMGSLWSSDSTPEGIFKPKFTTPEPNSANWLSLYQGKLYFVGDHSIYGREIFYIDLGQSCTVGSDAEDNDRDGICNIEDNCPETPNPNQEDNDNDGTGTICDCDETPETGINCSIGCQTFYLDVDGDTFGSKIDSINACTIPMGYVINKEDCDDNNSNINPNATEIANNGIDEDCNGEDLIEIANEEIDADGDGFNMENDCDDKNPNINPNATEIANNGIDEDCNGEDLIEITNEEIDADGDGFNMENDCDDNNPNINPNATEIVNNGIDEDCNGVDLIQPTIIDSCEVQVFVNGNTIRVTGLTDNHNKVYLYNGTIQTVLDSTCSYWQDCFNTKEFVNLPAGRYGVQYQTFLNGWSQINCDTLVFVTITGNNNPSDCDNITVKKQDNQLIIENLSVPNIILDLFNENYYSVYRCVGDCGVMQIVDGLITGKYFLKIKFYDASWNFICEYDKEIHFTEEGIKIGLSRMGNRFSLVGFLNRSNVALHWAHTSQEAKNQFLLEKSTDGLYFQPFLSKLAISGKESYTDIDPNPTVGNNYYRVITEFTDGHIEQSETIHVTWIPPNKLNLFPNPATDKVHISLSDYLDKELDLIFTDLVGKVIYREHFNKVSSPSISINLNRFDGGIYQISAIHKGYATTVKLVIIK